MRHGDSCLKTGFAIGIVALAGCSAGVSSPTSTVTQSDDRLAQAVFRPEAAGAGVRKVVVSSYDVGTVSIYDPSDGSALAKVGGLGNDDGGPLGVAVDASGHVYVADTQGFAKVYAFNSVPYPPLVLTATLDATGGRPIGVAVDPSSGIVALFDVSSSTEYGNVRVYAKGATEPCATISSFGVDGVGAGAFDASGNLYVTGSEFANVSGQLKVVPFVGIITGGCSASGISMLSLTSSKLQQPDAIQVTRGNLDILDAATRTIDLYDLPAAGATTLGAPRRSVHLDGAGYPGAFAFSQGSLYAWVADETNNAVDEYPFPGGGMPPKTFPGPDGLSGVAVIPAELP
jgi:DNA-binding beta-propeller fold protein YncE